MRRLLLPSLLLLAGVAHANPRVSARGEPLITATIEILAPPTALTWPELLFDPGICDWETACGRRTEPEGAPPDAFFAAESLHFALDDATFRVLAWYELRLPASSSLTVMLPNCAGERITPPGSVRHRPPGSERRAIPLRVDGPCWFMTLVDIAQGAHGFRLEWTQELQDGRIRYPFTSGLDWNGPIGHVALTVATPRLGGYLEANLPLEIREVDREEVLYHFSADQFVPGEDLTLRWIGIDDEAGAVEGQARLRRGREPQSRPLAYFNAIVAPSGRGTIADDQGRFHLPEVQCGIHRLILRHISVPSAEEFILVLPGEVTSVEAEFVDTDPATRLGDSE